MSAPPENALPEDETTLGATPSVLQTVSSGRRARRRARPSAWTLWISRHLTSGRLFVTDTIPRWARQHRQYLVTGSVSFVVHLLAAIILALWVLPPETTDQILTLLAVPVEEEEQNPIELAEIVQPETLEDLDVDSTVQQVLEVIDETSTDLAPLDNDQEFQLDLEPVSMDLSSLYKKGDLGGRSAFGKKAAIQKYGGTVESERAVNAGLRWLQGIQQSDGSWSFGSPGPDARPGRLASTDMGATSMALLCFLGAGHTHRTSGPYRDNVARGLTYMKENAKKYKGTADLRGNFEGNSGLYVQGLATICICEAHAMTPDDYQLRRLARGAVGFVELSQDKRGGGWRYRPEDPGDTSVIGWQVMALQSAKSGKIDVSRKTLYRVEQFLDSVQTQDGAQYKYMPGNGSPKHSTTAVGLLCRMYLGWRRDHPVLAKGVGYLSALGPHQNDMYYNYYATQVLHHWGGSRWRDWNEVMREQLVTRQLKDGPAAGSWPTRDPHGSSGGQIYETALSLLTLEVYYRHLPIYRQLEE